MATAGMTAEENKTVVRRYIEEAWNRHNIDATDELVSPGMVVSATRVTDMCSVGYGDIWADQALVSTSFAGGLGRVFLRGR